MQVNDEVRDFIACTMQENDETSLRQLQSGLAAKGFDLSTSTIDRVRRKLGYTFKGEEYLVVLVSFWRALHNAYLIRGMQGSPQSKENHWL